MKKTIILSSLLLVACTVITSCKKSSTNSSIVGNWELTSIHEVTVDSTTSPVSVTTLDTTVAHNHSLVISFFADNTLTEYSFLSTPPTIQSTGNYVVVGDSLTLFDGSSVQTVHFTVSGNSLTLNVNQNNPGFSSTSAIEKFNRQ